jgi:hypothetical protein
MSGSQPTGRETLMSHDRNRSPQKAIWSQFARQLGFEQRRAFIEWEPVVAPEPLFQAAAQLSADTTAHLAEIPLPLGAVSAEPWELDDCWVRVFKGTTRSWDGGLVESGGEQDESGDVRWRAIHRGRPARLRHPGETGRYACGRLPPLGRGTGTRTAVRVVSECLMNGEAKNVIAFAMGSSREELRKAPRHVSAASAAS